MRVVITGCLGTPVEMRGSKGTFGISDDQYHNDMRCSWKIQVDPFKVRLPAYLLSHIVYIHMVYIFKHLLTSQYCDNIDFIQNTNYHKYLRGMNLQ